MTKDELRAWMNGAGLTPKQLADLLPSSPRTIENWMQGRRATPSYLPRLLQSVARELAGKKS